MNYEQILIFLISIFIFYILLGMFTGKTKSNKEVIESQVAVMLTAVNDIIQENIIDYKLDYEFVTKENFTIYDALHFYELLKNSITNSEYISQENKDLVKYVLGILPKFCTVNEFSNIIYSLIYNKGLTDDKEDKKPVLS